MFMNTFLKNKNLSFIYIFIINVYYGCSIINSGFVLDLSWNWARPTSGSDFLILGLTRRNFRTRLCFANSIIYYS